MKQVYLFLISFLLISSLSYSQTIIPLSPNTISQMNQKRTSDSARLHPILAIEGRNVGLCAEPKYMKWKHWLWPWGRIPAYHSGHEARKERREQIRDENWMKKHEKRV